MPKAGRRNSYNKSLFAKVDSDQLHPEDVFKVLTRGGNVFVGPNSEIGNEFKQAIEKANAPIRGYIIDERFSEPGSINLKKSGGDLYTWQNYLNNGTVRSVMKNLNKRSRPLVVKLNNNYLIADGNHRVAAAIILGKSTLKANIIDLNKMLK